MGHSTNQLELSPPSILAASRRQKVIDGPAQLHLLSNSSASCRHALSLPNEWGFIALALWERQGLLSSLFSSPDPLSLCEN